MYTINMLIIVIHVHVHVRNCNSTTLYIPATLMQQMLAGVGGWGGGGFKLYIYTKNASP